MKFKKIYVEITNVCNFNCSFCFPASRGKRFMSPDDFRIVAKAVKILTDYVYLHVLGEPLLHPQLDEILGICEETGLYVNITTNGSLLEKKKEILTKRSVRQINISLHDAEENIPQPEWADFISRMVELAKELSGQSYINFRLWNQTNASSDVFNTLCYRLLSEAFALAPNFDFKNNETRSLTLAPGIYLQNAPRFEWQQAVSREDKSCYALKDQVAVLANGDVVPCCIDAEANLYLGNVFVDDLTTIIRTERAVKIREGFDRNKAVEDFCKKCGFRV